MGVLINIRVALAAKRWRCLDLAKALDVSPAKLSLVINGYSEPDSNFRKKCAEALGVREKWLFSRYRRIPVVNDGRGAEVARPFVAPGLTREGMRQ